MNMIPEFVSLHPSKFKLYLKQRRQPTAFSNAIVFITSNTTCFFISLDLCSLPYFYPLDSFSYLSDHNNLSPQNTLCTSSHISCFQVPLISQSLHHIYIYTVPSTYISSSQILLLIYPRTCLQIKLHLTIYSSDQFNQLPSTSSNINLRRQNVQPKVSFQTINRRSFEDK